VPDTKPLKSAEDVLRDALRSQYHASLEMLRQSIELCSDDTWSATCKTRSPFWRVVYHTLYYTHLYLSRDDESFSTLQLHQTGIQDLDGVPAPPELIDLLEPAHRPPQTGVPYTRDELLDYWRFCDALVDPAIDELDVLAPDSGFRWHNPPRPKVEQHVDNIRHIQHHTSQLAVRIRASKRGHVEWVAAWHPPEPDVME